tara:strand:+ start:3412 stop:3711 length:300 start_codon:yes stop_codon:yes gene_type:complete
MLIILIVSLVIDLISFNYFLSTLFTIFIPVIIINNFLNQKKLSLTIVNFSVILTSFLILMFLDSDFYNRVDLIQMIPITLIIIFTNFIFLKKNEFRFRY